MNLLSTLIPSGRPGLRAKVFASILAMAGAAAILSPAAAQAGSSMTGMQKCKAGLPPDEIVPFNQTGGGHVSYPAGPNPPNGIFPGNALHVVVDWNSLVDISFWGEWYNINGKAEAATSGYPFPGWPKYADLFRMNNNPGGWVASGSDPNPWDPHMLRELNATACFAAPALPARMGVQMNDDNLSDNQGAWKWSLEIWRNS